MRVGFHLGARTQLGDHINDVFKKERKFFADNGIAVFLPDEYAKTMRDLGAMSSELVAILLDAHSQATSTRTYANLAFSNEHFMSTPSSILSQGELYLHAEAKAIELAHHFQGHDLTIVLVIESLATFFENSPNPRLSEELVNAPKKLICEISWYEIAKGIIDMLPDIDLVVVISETAPAYFEDVIRHLTGYSGEKPVKGRYVPLANSLTVNGRAKLGAILEGKNPRISQLRPRECEHLLLTFRDRQRRPSYHSPLGWDEGFLRDLDQKYAADFEKLGSLERTTIVGRPISDSDY